VSGGGTELLRRDQVLRLQISNETLCPLLCTCGGIKVCSGRVEKKENRRGEKLRGLSRLFRYIQALSSLNSWKSPKRTLSVPPPPPSPHRRTLFRPSSCLTWRPSPTSPRARLPPPPERPPPSQLPRPSGRPSPPLLTSWAPLASRSLCHRPLWRGTWRPRGRTGSTYLTCSFLPLEPS
jgi:hypothetical protein